MYRTESTEGLSAEIIAAEGMSHLPIVLSMGMLLALLNLVKHTKPTATPAMSLSTVLNYLRPLQHLIIKPLPAVQVHPIDPWFGSGGCSQCPSPLSPRP